MSELRDTGALKIAEATASMFLGLIAAIPDDMRLGREDLQALFVDANVMVLESVAPRDRAMRAYAKWCDDKGMKRPRDTGTAQRLGLLDRA